MPTLLPLAILLLGVAPELNGSLSESTREQIESAAQYATAETLFQKGDLEAALRGYQRAWRRAPQLQGPLEKIVPLAFSLGQTEVAVRYALADAAAADPPLLRRLAMYQTEQQEWASALRLYRLWLEKSPPGKTEKDRLARLMVQLEVARQAYLIDEVQAASRSFEPVQQVLAGEGVDRDLSKSLRAVMGDGVSWSWEIMGRCHLEAKRFALARAAFEQMARSPDMAPEANYWLAEVSAAQGKPLVAYDLLGKYFQAGDNPYGAAPYDLHRRLLETVGDNNGLLADLSRWSGEDRPNATLALAEAKAKWGDAAEAEKLHRALLARAGDQYRSDPIATSSSESLDSTIVTRSAAWLIEHLATQRRLGEFASLLKSVGGALANFDALDEALQQAVADESQRSRLATRLNMWKVEERTMGELSAGAWAAQVAGEADLALRLQQAFLRRSGEDSANHALLWAVEQLYDDRPKQASAMLRWGIDQGLWDNDAAEPHFYLATALAMYDEHDAALAQAREAARRAPDSADIAARVGWVLYNADRREEATRVYRQVIVDFDDDPDSSTRAALKEARSTLSYLHLKQGNIGQAVEWLEQVLDEYPADPGALNDLAYLWADRGEHLARAERMARAAVAAEPDSAAYLDTLAWAEFRRGKLTDALATIGRAIDLTIDEPDGEILDHQGDILAALDRQAEAVASWQQAATLLDEVDAELAAKVRAKLPDGESSRSQP